MNVLKAEKQLAVISALVEGVNIWSIERMTGVHRDTIMRLTVRVGERCAQIMDETMRGLRCRRVQVDEIWTYVQKKEGHKEPAEADNQQIGDAYTFIALERTNKLVVAWHLGKRDGVNTEEFIAKVRRATADNRFEICTDAFQPYAGAIDLALSDRADYSQVIKVYSKQEEGRERYSPGSFVTVEKQAILGEPNLDRASTSHVERQNGTLRQWCKRLTRLTYAFSKKWENLQAALALHFAYYNFCRIHGKLRVTPAMEAGIADHVWGLDELISTL